VHVRGVTPFSPTPYVTNLDTYFDNLCQKVTFNSKAAILTCLSHCIARFRVISFTYLRATVVIREMVVSKLYGNKLITIIQCKVESSTTLDVYPMKVPSLIQASHHSLEGI